ncbi:MAG: arylsulfatase, partial [Planctomycetota bacterium]
MQKRLLLIVVFSLSFASGAESKPNIVYIMADDLGIGDVKCFGGDRCQIETPSFDRLAREGMMFLDAHSVSSVCVPSRAAILTGKYPWRLRSSRPSGPWGYINPRFRTTEPNLPRILGRANYRRGYVGKWHLGTVMQTTDGKNQGPRNVDYSKPLKVCPLDYGFDESFILPGSLDMYPYVFVRGREWVGKVNRQKGWSAFHRVGPTAEDFEDHKVLDTFCREAESFLSEHAKSKRPFFLYLALTSPHTPLSPKKAFQGRSRLGVYGDFVMETDDCVRHVLDALDRLGVSENTLVIATSDHGAAPYAGRRRKATPGQLKELEKEGHFSSGIYRGYKFSGYEGGIRVPFVARWPAVIPAGSRCDRLIGLQDVVATFAAVAGVETTDREAVDSISFLPLLRDPASHATRETLVARSTHSFVVRSGPWKLLLCPGSGCEGRFGNSPALADAWRDARRQFGRVPSREDLTAAPFIQLYHLGEDPGERKDLAAKKPGVVRELVAKLRSLSDRGRSTPGPQLENETNGASFWARVPKLV